jgi:hypothetical protein
VTQAQPRYPPSQPHRARFRMIGTPAAASSSSCGRPGAIGPEQVIPSRRLVQPHGWDRIGPLTGREKSDQDQDHPTSAPQTHLFERVSRYMYKVSKHVRYVVTEQG